MITTKITNYHVTDRHIILYEESGGTQTYLRTHESGKIVYRNKVATVFGVDHPGIILGNNEFNERGIVHHHIDYIQPVIHDEETYRDGEIMHFDPRPVYFTPDEIVKRAMALWFAGQSYDLFIRNCQNFVNRIARNENSSDTIDTVTNWMMGLGAVAAIGGELLGNKDLRNIGLGVAGAGVTGKFFNHI